MNQGFRVEARSVYELSVLVSRQGEAAGLYRSLFDKPSLTTSESEQGGLQNALQIVQPGIQRWENLAERNTATAEQLALAAGEQLRGAARFYRSVDAGEATRLDATYPPEHEHRIARDKVHDHGRAQRFDDWRDPTEDPRHPGQTYGGPPDPTAERVLRDEPWLPLDIEKLVAEITGAGGSLGAIADIVKRITGRDIFREANDAVAGDWQQVYRTALLFKDTGSAFHIIDANIDQGRFGIQDDWTGNAAGAAEQWLAQYARASAAHSEFLTQAGDRIGDWAQSSYHQMQVLRYGLATIIDAVVALLTREGAAESGVKKVFELIDDLLSGASVADSGLGAADHPILTLIAQIHQMVFMAGLSVGALLTLAHDFAAAAEAIASLEPVDTSAWPAHPYHHPEG